LLSNAIRYTPRGSVQVTCSGSGEDLSITVRDTGIGIPSDELGKVFEEFYQVDRGPQRPEGLGLGLSIVKRLSALLGYRIAVESVVNEGTAFTVMLPRGAPATTAARGAAATADARIKGKILIVDDEVAVAHATGVLLELEGFEVSVANGKSEALERVRTTRPDLIVSDYHLRGTETGADVVAAVRARVGAELPVIFVTGDTSKVARAGTDLGNTILLSKPTQVDELLSAIQRQLGAIAR
jgi:two-component system CheB/CheR fusion protein